MTPSEEMDEQLRMEGLHIALDLLYKHGMPEGARIILRELVARKKALEEK
jgi:hypothetical protein